MNSKRIYVVGGSVGYANWIRNIGYELTDEPRLADVAMFTGGEDVNPEVYNEQAVGAFTSFNSYRDENEIKMFHYFFQQGIPMIGICRGGQLLTALSGGKLVQHSTHPSRHEITTIDGKTLEVTSSHHQQFLVDSQYTGLIHNIDYKLLGWAKNLSTCHLNGKQRDYNFPDDYQEPEIVYFKNTNSLAIQSHPEWQDNEHETVKYLQDLFTKFIERKL